MEGSLTGKLGLIVWAKVFGAKKAAKNRNSRANSLGIKNRLTFGKD